MVSMEKFHADHRYRFTLLDIWSISSET
jgi:hypothetical protein